MVRHTGLFNSVHLYWRLPVFSQEVDYVFGNYYEVDYPYRLYGFFFGLFGIIGLALPT